MMISKKHNIVATVLVLIVAMSMVLPASSNVVMNDDSEPERVLIYTYNTDADSIEALGIEIVEEYESFVMADATAIQQLLLERSGVRLNDMDGRGQISVNGYHFNIFEEAPPIQPHLLCKGYAPGEYGPFLVHTIGPVKNQWAEALENLDARIITYMPNYAYEVVMTPETRPKVEALDFVDWVDYYHPGFKLGADLAGNDLSISLMASPLVDETLLSIIQRVEIKQITPTELGYHIITSEADRATIEYFARFPGVQFIGPHYGDALQDEVGMQIMGGFCWYNDPDGDPTTPYRTTGPYGAYVNHLGWTGAGTTIAIADTGLGDGTTGNAGHNDFTGRVIGGMAVGGGSWADGHGHGTHCAGLLAADGTGNGVLYAGHGPYYVGMGLAYNTQIYAEKIFSDAGGWLGAAYGDIPMWGWSGGGRIHSNSWGESFGDGQYDARCEAYDQRARDANDTLPGNQNLVIFVAAGNSGAGPSLGGPSTGKNVIAVGSLHDYMPDAGTYGNTVDSGTNPDMISSFSSRGTTDNRIKPDIMTPGQSTLSLRSPNAPLNCLYGTYTGDNRYEWCSGTSQACPTGAGGGTLIYDYFQTTYGVPPSPAMVKAILTNTAVNIGFTPCPNDEYGWGRMYLPTFFDPPAPFMIYDNEPELTTGVTASYRFAYVNGAEPIKITLAYSDDNAINGANPTLLNRVNLEVESPTGQIYYGNGFSGAWTPAGNPPPAGVWDNDADNRDDRNNVEAVFIPPGSGEPGLYTVRVIGSDVNSDCDNDGTNDQDYSLVIYNAVDVTSEGTITLDQPVYQLSDTVWVEVADTDLNTHGGVETTTVVVDSTTEPAGESVLLTETGGNTSIFQGLLPISGTDGAGVLWVSDGDTITATYNDADNGTGNPATVTDTAIVDGDPPQPPTGLTVVWVDETADLFWIDDFEDGDVSDWTANPGTGIGGVSMDTANSGVWSMYSAEGTYTWDSPAIDLSTLGNAELNIWIRQGGAFGNSENPDGGEDLEVWYYNNAATWIQLGTFMGADAAGTSYSPVYPLPADALHTGFQVRFTQTGGSGTGFDYWHWDDVRIMDTTPSVGSGPDNRLNWVLSTDDGAGDNDVVAYNIYRANNSGGPWDMASHIDTVLPGTDTYYDYGRGEYDGINWWYVVRAEDAVGNEEQNTNAVPEVFGNPAPSVPTNPIPNHLAVGVGLNPTLSVDVSDPNGDTMDVSFYDASGPTLIGTDFGVSSPGTASFPWSGLSADTTYTWYAVADDGTSATPSPVWQFTTMDTTAPAPPTGLTVQWYGLNDVTVFLEDFEDALGPEWTTYESNPAVARNQLDTYDSVSGTQSWRMDVTTDVNYNLNELIVSFDGSPYSILNLTFWTIEYGDEQELMSATFVDHENSDGIAVSTDGTNWVQLWQYPATVSAWTQFGPFDIGSVIPITGTVHIKFQQYDNYAIPTDGFLWDDIHVQGREMGVGTEDNRLDWTLSTDDGGGTDDVALYNIYRALGPAGPWDMGAYIDSVTEGMSTYIDYNVGEFDGINWWYVVRAEDIWGNEEPNTNAVPEIPVGDMPPTVTVDAPNGGEVYPADSLITVDWTAADDNPWGPTPNCWIYYDDDTNPGNGETLITDVRDAGAGTHAWDATGVPAGNYYIHIVVVDSIGQTAEDWSNGFITILPPVYNIDLTGFGVGDWVFVSYPIEATGDPLTVFDDANWGDGQTTWDIAQWYDNVNKLWQTYSIYRPPAINDNVVFDNTMGVWLHLTANGGDQQLTVGTGSLPAIDVTINLFTGWNLVGYPSAIPRLGSATLPGEADLMAIYDPAQPYLILDVLPTTTPMSEGNAYWVHVIADTVWTVSS